MPEGGPLACSARRSGSARCQTLIALTLASSASSVASCRCVQLFLVRCAAVFLGPQEPSSSPPRVPSPLQKLDPMQRKLLEVSYEAVMDANINIDVFRGTDRAGVYIGAMSSEAKTSWIETCAPSEISGYELLGCGENMLSNRLSYFYDLHGPSCVVDTGVLGRPGTDTCVYVLGAHSSCCGSVGSVVKHMVAYASACGTWSSIGALKLRFAWR